MVFLVNIYPKSVLMCVSVKKESIQLFSNSCFQKRRLPFYFVVYKFRRQPYIFLLCQWLIQDFPLGGGGADLRRGHFSVKTKESGPVGGGTTPLDPPMCVVISSKYIKLVVYPPQTFKIQFKSWLEHAAKGLAN